MKLTLLDRVLLVSSLPGKGNFSQLILRRDIMERVAIKQEELKKYKFRSEGDQTMWAPTEDEFEYTFSELERGYMTDMLKKLDEDSELTTDYLHLYELFIK